MKHHAGRLELICGSMFSGKTEELIRRVRRAIIARQHVQVFKPRLDTRYGISDITSHDGQTVHAQTVDNCHKIQRLLEPQTTVVAIDEIQFFEPDVVQLVEGLANRGLRVLAAGLDLDFRGEPFGPMPQLLCHAEYVTKLHAICVVCGEPATRSQRLVNGAPAHYNEPVVQIGAEESYEARCRDHHVVPMG